jgi:3-oxoisoapionate decarboxylase
VTSSSRRVFITNAAAAGAGLALSPLAAASRGVYRDTPARAAVQVGEDRRLKLGLDNFAVRAMGWKAGQLIEYAASLRLDSLLISDLDAFESLEEAHLRELRARASDLGLTIHAGTWSICPTSKSFRPTWGTAEEHLALGIRVAGALGSPVIRVILGTHEDRLGEGGIDRHIESTLAVCRARRSQALDAGVQIAVENHAGDLHSRELVQLIEAAGTEYVGANLDSGNAFWALEDPLDNLENLGPYVLTTSLRDGAAWDTDAGVRVQWTAMGEGQIDLPRYFARFAELCPHAPVHIETISGFSREFPYLRREFWRAWPHLRAADFAAFLRLAREGRPREPFTPAPGMDKKEAEQAYQRAELERSLEYCRTLGRFGD